jgi:phage shock protein PspC (stress-responsive transcriptional regulator)
MSQRRGGTAVEGRRWSRPADDRWIAGVASGVARAIDAPFWIVRAAFVAATAIGGIGVLAYLFLWWLLPREGAAESSAQRTARRFPEAPTWLGVILLVLGVMLFAGQLGWWRPSLLWALVLIGIGIVLFRRDALEAGEPSSGDPDLAAEGTDRVDVPALPEGSATAPLRTVRARRERPPREHSFLGVLVFGLALSAWGAVALLDATGATSLSTAAGLSLALLVLGVGLVVGAFIGRSRWLILPALLLAPLALLATVVNLDLNEGFGDRHVAVVDAAQLPGTYRLAGGMLSVDLTQPPGGVSNAEVTAEVGAGVLEIRVPADATVRIDGDVGIGVFKVFVERSLRLPQAVGSIRREISEQGGVDVQIDRTIEPGSTVPTITLHVHASIGEIDLIREEASR